MLGSASQKELLERFYQAGKNLGQSERYRAASLAESYYLQKAYAYKKAAWNDPNAKLSEKAPPLKMGLYRLAIDRLERLVWGGHRFPAAHIPPTDVESGLGDIGPVTGERESQALSRYLRDAVVQGKLPKAAREFSRCAMITTSAAVVLGVRGGYLTTHIEPGKDCQPTFDETGRRLKQLDVLKQYEKDEPNGLGGITKKRVWYRRVVDGQADTVFKEVPVTRYAEPKWEVDPDKTVVHNFGFCPAVWVRTCGDSSDSVDGRPVIDPSLYPLIEAFDYNWSLKDRAVKYGTDPQLVRRGVPESRQEDLVKGAGNAWDLPDPNQDIRFLETTGSGAQRAGEHLAEMKQAFCEAVNIVLTDPAVFRGDLSGPVLEMLHAPMIALAADLRDDFGDAYATMLNLVLRMTEVLVARGEGLLVPGIRAAAQAITTAQAGGDWLDFPIAIDWPTWFPLTATDKSTVQSGVIAAQAAGLIRHETAVRAVAPFYGVENPKTEAALAAQELADAQARAKAMAPAPTTPTAPVTVAPSPEAQAAADAAQAQAAAAKAPGETP